jgi:protein phosphatase
MTHHPNSQLEFSLRWSACTDRGKVRANNEDTFLGLLFNAYELHFLGKFGDASVSQNDFVFAVSDGMGGAKAGELASRITLDKITELLPRSYKQAAIGLEAGFSDVIDELFEEVNMALTYVGGSYEECYGMQATLSLCWFTPGRMYFGHIGDSRIYYLPAGEQTLKQLSHDDTYVGWLYRNGKLNERQARAHPQRTSLQKSLGAGSQFVDPQVGAVSYQAGDRFLLCTDGLVDGLYDHQIAELMQKPLAPGQDMAKELVNAAVSNSGADNTTALLIQVG